MKNKKMVCLFQTEVELKKVILAAVMALVVMAVVWYPQIQAFATDTAGGVEVITERFDVLLSLVEGIVSSIGMIVTLWGISEWGIAFQGTEGTMQAGAFKRMGGGMLMTLAPQILPALIG